MVQHGEASCFPWPRPLYCARSRQVRRLAHPWSLLLRCSTATHSLLPKPEHDQTPLDHLLFCVLSPRSSLLAFGLQVRAWFSWRSRGYGFVKLAMCHYSWMYHVLLLRLFWDTCASFHGDLQWCWRVLQICSSFCRYGLVLPFFYVVFNFSTDSIFFF